MLDVLLAKCRVMVGGSEVDVGRDGGRLVCSVDGAVLGYCDVRAGEHRGLASSVGGDLRYGLAECM